MEALAAGDRARDRRGGAIGIHQERHSVRVPRRHRRRDVARAHGDDAHAARAQLDAQARAFVNDPFRNRYDKAARTAHLSEIFKWFAEDFAGPAGSVQKYVARYVADPDVARALANDSYEVKWIDYDWTLNGTPPRP